MERRYLAFFAASFAIILLWQAMFPPRPAVDRAQQAAAEAEDEAAAPAAEQDKEADEADEADDEAAPQIEAPPPADSPHYLTLGSLDASSPYRMLVTFDSHGATVHRVQLARAQYRDLHDESGFLGEVEWINAPGRGAEAQVVGAGTPAAKAGLQPGDVVTEVAVEGNRNVTGGKIASAGELAELLSHTRPGNTLEMQVERSGKPHSLTADLVRRPLELIRPEEENILLHSDELPQGFEHRGSLDLAIRSVAPREVAEADLQQANEQLSDGVWAVDDSQANRLDFSMVLPKLGLEVIKRFEIATVPEQERTEANYPGYHLEFDVELRNLLPDPQEVSYELQGPNGLPIEGWWYSSKVGRSWSGYGIRDVVLRTYGRGEVDFPCREIAEGEADPFGDGESLAYIGVDAQYFAAALVPKKEREDERWYAQFRPNLASTLFDEDNSYRLRYQNASFLLRSRPLLLAAADSPGSERTHSLTLFTGPKHPELLSHYEAPAAPGHTLSDFVYYGWFGSIGIPQAMVWILSSFYGIVHNYGLAIVLLTVLVRSCMFPLSRKQAMNMLKMQELKPEMDRIAKRYKEDVQARTKAQQELWARHNYNPMGGCLLMFIQLPIFIGLYRALMVDVDLRQAPLIPGLRWCSNLAAPDMLLNWENWFWPDWFLNGEGILALGPYLNILPLATVALFLVQQKLFMPPPTDEQAVMMQKVMKYMLIVMSFMFFKVASGLCVYFIATSLWGIGERKLIPPPTLNNQSSEATEPPPSARAEARTRKKKTAASSQKRGKSGGKSGGKRKR